jgi:hypothetical protein
MRLTVTSHLTLDGVMQSNGKPEPELSDGFEHRPRRSTPAADWTRDSNAASMPRPWVRRVAVCIGGPQCAARVRPSRRFTPNCR